MKQNAMLSFMFWLSYLAIFPASSTASSGYRPSGAKCTEYCIPVDITAGYLAYSGMKWSDNNELAQFSADYVARTPDKPPFLGNPSNTTKQYKISATFCTPLDTEAQHANTVLLATHGLGFDRSYWNLAYKPEQHNFAQFAINRGYSIFLYDRVSTGDSTRTSGWTAQISEHIAVLTQLASFLKAGKYTGVVGPADAVALIGHSIGSLISHGVTAYSPSAIDAVILTAFGLNSSAIDFDVVLEAWNPRIANTQTNAFSSADLELDAGFLTWVDVYANINTFFKAPYYDFAAAEYAESHKRPWGVVEALSAEPTLATLPIPRFTGPVLLISGEYDFIFCNGYCPDVLAQPATKVFSASKDFEAYVQPGMSHNMNMHHNATGYFDVVLKFLDRNGL